MRTRRVAILAAIIACLAFWLFWNRPRHANMAEYVPAESLAFVEVNDLPEFADGIVNTDAWKALSSPAGATLNFPYGRWLIGLARWTGIGSAETVLLARSQFAISWMDVSQNEVGTTLAVKPVGALVIETHTTQLRMRPVFEKKIEELVHRKYREAQLQHKIIGEADFFEWSTPDGKPQIVFAFVGSVGIIGNDERPVQACLLVRNGERPGLNSSEVFNMLRTGTETSNRLGTFGFLSPSGIKKVIPYLPELVGRYSDSSNVVQLLANVAASLTNGIGWMPSFVNGAVEDHLTYLLADGVAQKLRDGVAPEQPAALKFVELLPADTKSFTQYNFRQPAEAWRGLNAAISLHVDVVSSIIARRVLLGALANYGIENPDTFLASIGPEISTVRLSNSTSPIVIGQVLDAAMLSKQLREHLGPGPSVERVGEAEISVSTDSKRGAISLLGNEFLMGSAEDLRRSLEAQRTSNTIARNDSFRRAQQLLNPSALTTAVTFSSDESDAISFVSLFSSGRNEALPEKADALREARKYLPYAVKTTQFNEIAFTQTSRSSFGIAGSLLVRLFPGD